MSNVDHTIARDLAALGENSRRDVPALDEALRTTDAYRDDRPGAEARRNALAEQRRKELVLMPLTLAHVFTHRLGRAAAGGMALAVSLVMMAMIADPLLMRFAAWFIPGLNVGMLVLIGAIAILKAYVIASWVGEIWFARRMRAAIKTSSDAYEDIQQLAEGPLEIAQRAVARVDGWSMGLFLAGTSAVTLVYGYTVIVVGMNHTLSHAWSMIGIMNTHALENNAGILAWVLTVSGIASFVVARACARDRVGDSAFVRGLGRWPTLALAGALGIVVLYNMFHVAAGTHRVVSAPQRIVVAFAASIAIYLPLAYGMLFWRRREQARIG